jgi:uncharacterized membrane protein YGL010W
MNPFYDWLESYQLNHRHPVNYRIHFIGIPVIYFSLLACLSGIPSLSLHKLLPSAYSGYAHFGTLLVPFLLLFYLRLSTAIMLGMTVFSLLCLIVINVLGKVGISVWMLGIPGFVSGWAAQLYGHYLEGNRPSFLKDLKHMLMAPAWWLAMLYKKAGIRF